MMQSCVLLGVDHTSPVKGQEKVLRLVMGDFSVGKAGDRVGVVVEGCALEHHAMRARKLTDLLCHGRRYRSRRRFACNTRPTMGEFTVDMVKTSSVIRHPE